jgi:hypothetical protein
VTAGEPAGEAGEPRKGAEQAGKPGDMALEVYRRTNRMVHRSALLRLLRVLPRTLRFVADNLDRRLAGLDHDEPAPSLSLGLLGSVAVDEAIVAVAMGPRRFPRRADYQRVGAELRACRAQFEERGWLADPVSYHREPPPLTHPVATRATTATTMAPGGSPLLRFEKLLFASEFEPRSDEIGRERYVGYEPNRVGAAWVLRHRGADRPWVVCVHGFGMGYPIMDFGAFEPRVLHERMGFNLALPVLPLHGHRKVTPMSGDAFLSFDLMNAVHGLTHAAWDVRRVLSWVRSQTSRPVGLYGVSLGAYVGSLVAALDSGLACVIAGIPVCDIPSLYAAHSPAALRLRALEHGILGGVAEDVHRVVSPLAMEPLVPPERLAIYAGIGDRVAIPAQAERLRARWGTPRTLFYPGNHVGFLRSTEVAGFVRGALRGARAEVQ